MENKHLSIYIYVHFRKYIEQQYIMWSYMYIVESI